MAGRLMSSRIRARSSVEARSRPVAPSWASSTRKSDSSSERRMIRLRPASSSTTRTSGSRDFRLSRSARPAPSSRLPLAPADRLPAPGALLIVVHPYWQCEGESAAASCTGRIRPDSTAVRGHDTPTDREPQAGPPRRSHEAGLGLLEGLEYLLELFASDPLAGVLHAHTNLVVACRGGDPNLAALGRVFHRVVHQV